MAGNACSIAQPRREAVGRSGLFVVPAPEDLAGGTGARRNPIF
jgi:hypothetical protein